MSMSKLPVSDKTLAKAGEYVDKKRRELGVARARRADFFEGMVSDIASTLGEMGVSSLVIGDQHIPLSEAGPRSPSVEDRWTQSLNEGKFVACLTAGFVTCTMFRGDKHVRMKDRSLDVLVDCDRIRTLAPDAVVYGPGEVAPWPNLISTSAFSIWVDDRAQFDALWAGVKEWMKTAWFDETMRQRKERFTADEIFHVVAHYDIAPDLSWREAQFKRAEVHSEQAAELGAWDALGQQEIKKAIGSLLQLEGHPLLGAQAEQMIAALTPMLGCAMDGKERAKKLSEAGWKARDACWSGFKTIQVPWKEHASASPLPAVIPSRKAARSLNR